MNPSLMNFDEGEKHREANTKHDQDNFALQDLQELQDVPRGNTDNMQKPTNFNKVSREIIFTCYLPIYSIFFVLVRVFNVSFRNITSLTLLQVMKLKSLKPNYKMEKYYKKMLAKEKMRMKKKKHSKKQQKHQIP